MTRPSAQPPIFAEPDTRAAALLARLMFFLAMAMVVVPAAMMLRAAS